MITNLDMSTQTRKNVGQLKLLICKHVCNVGVAFFFKYLLIFTLLFGNKQKARASYTTPTHMSWVPFSLSQAGFGKCIQSL